jgi:hypothetical protein
MIVGFTFSLWDVLIVLGIIALALFILGIRR